jgi:TfoX/Sxy family transcriptional regulator of competence genes
LSRPGSEALGAYDLPVAYDEKLAARIRDLVADESGVTERRMFGGLAFLVNGNMAVAASGQGGLLVRVDPAESDALVTASPARPMEMRGREMPGWLRVGGEDVHSKKELRTWVERGVTYARSLPAKQ